MGFPSKRYKKAGNIKTADVDGHERFLPIPGQRLD